MDTMKGKGKKGVTFHKNVVNKYVDKWFGNNLRTVHGPPHV